MFTHIRRTMGEFVWSETGLVRQQAGLPMAWAVGTLVAMAVFFGTPDMAAAACNELTGTSCTANDQCQMYCQIYQGCAGGECRPSGYCFCCTPYPCGS